MLYCCIVALSEGGTTKQYATILRIKYNHGWNMMIPMFVGAQLKIFMSKMFMGYSIPWLTDKKSRNNQSKVEIIHNLISQKHLIDFHI